jgi:hypothetical protein
MNLSQELQRSLFDGIYSSFIDWRNDYSSYALGANLSYIYIREYMWVYKILERAINEAKAAG